jgi:hypothetical protein
MMKYSITDQISILIDEEVVYSPIGVHDTQVAAMFENVVWFALSPCFHGHRHYMARSVRRTGEELTLIAGWLRLLIPSFHKKSLETAPASLARSRLTLQNSRETEDCKDFKNALQQALLFYCTISTPLCLQFTIVK